MRTRKYLAPLPMVGILGFICISIISVVYAINTISEGYRVDSGVPKGLDLRGTYGAGNCYQVTAPAGKSVFIPTRTIGEWNTVKSNAYLAGVTLNACVDGGWSGWYYWYSSNYGCGSYTYDYYIRYCNNPSPSYGGAGCSGGDTTYNSYWNGSCPVCNLQHYTVVGPCTSTPDPPCSNDWANNGGWGYCSGQPSVQCICN